MELNNAPPLDGTETAYKVGYISLAVWGSQRSAGIDGRVPQYLEVLRILISGGAPVDQADIMGFTPIHHYLMSPAYGRRNVSLLELLPESGANPNAQDKVGSVPILAAFEHNYSEDIELLIQHGANLDIENADGLSPMSSYLNYGPIVTAAVEKGLRKRTGERMAREDKSCDNCHMDDKLLKGCAAYHIARYCSVKCQSEF